MMTPQNKQQDILEAVKTLQVNATDSAGRPTVITIEDIAQQAGVCWRTAQTHLKALVAAGNLERETAPHPAGVSWSYVYRVSHD